MQKRNPFILIKNINDKFEAKGNNECQKVGLTLSQFRILVYLKVHNEKTVTQREIELEFKVSHPTITGILRRMEEKGFVTTNIIKAGKMQKEVFMTEKGAEALKMMDASRDEDDAALLNLFSEQELNQLGDYLHRIFEYLNK